LSLIGGGTFIANIAWGIGEGIAINGLSNMLEGNSFFQGAGKAGAIGGIFALLTSSLESLEKLERRVWIWN